MINYKNEIGLYIHIPFCISKCFYCDFNSYTGYKENDIKNYFDALNKEIDIYSRELKNYSIKSIFIGGGTPSYVDEKYINKIISHCKKTFQINNNIEISIETNPGTLNKNKLRVYKESGINRLSIGLQAWQNSILQKLGRIHKNEDFERNIKDAIDIGFKNINVDLIFGIPEQSAEEWNETLNNVLKFNISHISAYSLKIEEGTKFGDLYREGKLFLLDDEKDREMYYDAIKVMKEYGLHQYEISNFAKEGSECSHNLVYWKGEEYLGVGAGAHSYLNSKRYSNYTDIKSYIDSIENENLPYCNLEVIGLDEKMSEFMILGLRLINGINIIDFKRRFNIDIFDKFGDIIKRQIEKEMIAFNGENIKLTPKGLDFANEVYIEFI